MLYFKLKGNYFFVHDVNNFAVHVFKDVCSHADSVPKANSSGFPSSDPVPSLIVCAYGV